MYTPLSVYFCYMRSKNYKSIDKNELQVSETKYQKQTMSNDKAMNEQTTRYK